MHTVCHWNQLCGHVNSLLQAACISSFRRCDPNYGASRHCSVVCRRQEAYHQRANGTIGRKRRDPWKSSKYWELKAWLKNLVISPLKWDGEDFLSVPSGKCSEQSVQHEREHWGHLDRKHSSKASCWIWKLRDNKEWISQNTQWERTSSSLLARKQLGVTVM